MPESNGANKKSLNLTPYDGHKFASYIEAWHLLRGTRVDEIYLFIPIVTNEALGSLM